jgi:hypothetical protein
MVGDVFCRMCQFERGGVQAFVDQQFCHYASIQARKASAVAGNQFLRCGPPVWKIEGKAGIHKFGGDNPTTFEHKLRLAGAAEKCRFRSSIRD